MKRALALATLLGVFSVHAAQAGETDRCAPMPVTHHVASAIAQPAPRGTVIASLNMAGRADIRDVLVAWARQRAIDVLLLQEVGGQSEDGERFVTTLGERLGFHVAYAPANRLDETHTQGLAIVSRQPLNEVHAVGLTYHRLRFRSRCRISLAATVATAEGPIRAVNVHLDTRINSGTRIEQLTPVVERLAMDPRPQIIGGDFNTMNVGWFNSMWPFPYLQRQAAAVRSFLEGEGFYTPFVDTRPTFKFPAFPLRLDWLYLKGLSATDWTVDDVDVTDHRGIWARVTGAASSD